MDTKNTVTDEMFTGTNLDMDFRDFMASGKGRMMGQREAFQKLVKKYETFFKRQGQRNQTDFEKFFSANERYLMEQAYLVTYSRSNAPWMVSRT